MKVPRLTALACFLLSLPSLAEEAPLLTLTKGDRWDYKVTVEAPRGSKMPGGKGITLKETLDGMTATFEKSRVYLGKTKPKKDEPERDTFQMIRDEQIIEFEFSDFQKDAIYALGSMDTTKKDPKVMLLSQPLLVYATSNKPGDRWEIKSGDGKTTPFFTRKFRIFGEEEVEVPAGTFTAVRILMTGQSGPTEIKRTVWFAKGTGFVKEEKTYYSADKRLINQKMELTKLTKGEE